MTLPPQTQSRRKNTARQLLQSLKIWQVPPALYPHLCCWFVRMSQIQQRPKHGLTTVLLYTCPCLNPRSSLGKEPALLYRAHGPKRKKSYNTTHAAPALRHRGSELFPDLDVDELIAAKMRSPMPACLPVCLVLAFLSFSTLHL